MNQSITETGAKLLKAKLIHLEKYKNLGGVKTYIEEFDDLINNLQRCYHPEYPPPSSHCGDST